MWERDTRSALLDAGVDLLLELTPAGIVSALRTREIARRAGVSPPTFFHHFRNVDDYAEALVDRVFSTSHPALRTVITEGLTEAQRLSLPAEQSIAYHRRDLERAAADPHFRIRLGLWALGGPGVDGPYRTFLDEVDRQLLPQAQALHDVWGREVRPPLDLRSYLGVQIAILNGAAARHLVDPSVMSAERYARAASALSMVLLRPTGDRRTMDDRLSEMNWFVHRRPSRPNPTQRRSSTRARLLEAATELFDEYGYAATSISRITAAAGVHVGTFYDHFESKDHVALVLFDTHATHALTEPASADRPPAAALRRHLEQLARLAGQRDELARIYFAAVGTGQLPADLPDEIGRRTRALVAACRSASDPDPAAVERAAEHLVVSTIGPMLRHPGDGATAAVEAALRML